MNRRPFCPTLQCLEEVSPDSSSIGALDLVPHAEHVGDRGPEAEGISFMAPVDSFYHLSNLIRVS